MDRIINFFEQLKGKKIAFFGIGVSHTKLITLLAKKGLDITACDERTKEQMEGTYAQLNALGVKLCLGETYLHSLDYDIIFRTPGMLPSKKELQLAKQKGIVVTSELEVFIALCPCKTIGITGSDGKTTTTTLIYECLKKQGYTTHLGGNIGTPLLPIIEQIKPEDIVVIELSSFQLISMNNALDSAVITNITPNHLDMHTNMQEYIQAKHNVFLHQNAFSTTVLNEDNEETRILMERVRGKYYGFSRKNPVTRGCYVTKDDSVVFIENGILTPIMACKDIVLAGVHNIENYLAAICAVWNLVQPSVIKEVAQTFMGVAHRMEFVKQTQDGITWYNDSIATSPTRTIAGLRTFSKKIIMIAGGYDKNLDYTPLAPILIEKTKALILMGTTAQKIENAIKLNIGYEQDSPIIYHVRTMEEAVDLSHKIGGKGDILALSPASASFDSYSNFEQRGNHFKQLVSRDRG
ncbi:MAG: UDP-N-acetylmuramoyl-L-alanine--D-glutamate ligase [Oscillospiraceae bacterium]